MSTNRPVDSDRDVVSRQEDFIGPTSIPESLRRSLDDAAQRAKQEDDCSVGVPVSRKLVDTLMECPSEEVRLSRETRKLMGHFCGRSSETIRVRYSPVADAIANVFGSIAFCLEDSIYVQRATWDRLSPERKLRVLVHEGSHLSRSIQHDLIRFWEGNGHSNLTSTAIETFERDFRRLISDRQWKITYETIRYRMRSEANARDNIGRAQRPMQTFAYILGGFVPYTLGTALSIGRHFSPLRWVFGSLSDIADLNLPVVSMLFSKGEGPVHGEGTNYRSDDPELNASMNRAIEDSEIKLAIESCGDKQRPGDADDLLEHLGKLLHTTQDRAAHREGRKGFGHNDARCAFGWKPDNENVCDHHAHHGQNGRSWWICSRAAYRRAQNNSHRVLERFFRGLGYQDVSAWYVLPEYCELSLEHFPLHLGITPASPNSPAALTDSRVGCIHGRNQQIQ